MKICPLLTLFVRLREKNGIAVLCWTQMRRRFVQKKFGEGALKVLWKDKCVLFEKIKSRWFLIICIFIPVIWKCLSMITISGISIKVGNMHFGCRMECSFL